LNDELGITILDFRLVIQKSSFVTLQSYIFMAEHNELGKFGEELAVEFLQQNGYTILETNWSFQKAEIDIIAQIGNTLAVVEVKTRSSIEFGLPQDFIKPKKIQLLVKAVNEYVTKNDLEFSIRFDVIAVYKEENNYNIDHIIDAFYHF
jgi:putative endonuclease